MSDGPTDNAQNTPDETTPAARAARAARTARTGLEFNRSIEEGGSIWTDDGTEGRTEGREHDLTLLHTLLVPGLCDMCGASHL